MAEAESTVWQLDKYARYVLPRQAGSSAGQWNRYDNAADSRLVMTLTEAKHLVVLHGSVVLESHSLVTARAWMRGLCKNDSLLFLYKQGKGTRRFRVKFAAVGGKTAGQICCDAAVKLSKLFTIHVTTPQPPAEKDDQNRDNGAGATGSSNASAPLVGEISLGTMAQIILGESLNHLPEAHRMKPTYGSSTRMTSLSDDVMINHLCLFLTDPTFPAFVEQVEGQLQKIIKECQDV